MDEKHSEQNYKNTLTKILRSSLSDVTFIKEILEQMFEDDALKEQGKLWCRSYQSLSGNTKLVSRSIDIRAVNALVKICKREGLGIMLADFSGKETESFHSGEKIFVFYLSGEEKKFQKALIEALVLSGTIKELKRETAEAVLNTHDKENPIFEIKGISNEDYRRMKQELDYFPEDMKITLMPKKNENGKLDIGFYRKTEEKIKAGGKKDVYSTLKLVSILMACAFLTKDVREEERKKKKENEKIVEALLNLYYNTSEAFYLIPGRITKENQFNPDWKQKECIDDKLSYEEFVDIILNSSKKINEIQIPMTRNEYEIYQGRSHLQASEISFYKDGSPKYIRTEQAASIVIEEKLIDQLNKKREQLLLMSDDFNGNNLENLANYIGGTVQEFLIREDEDYTDWLEEDELFCKTERELLHKLNEYTIEYAYENYDKVTELINEEKARLEQIQVNEAMEEVEHGWR